MRVLVLGGHGFVGRHAVAALERAGAEITIGTRRPQSSARHPEVRCVLHEAIQVDDWVDVVRSFDAVLNSVGILRQRPGESYETVHSLAPASIAEACEAHGVRFVHVSALGLSCDAKSRFLTSKLRGEQAITACNSRAIIARLSLLDGDGGFGASWLRGVARLPVFVVPSSARGRIAALTASDAGEALAELCLCDEERLGDDKRLGDGTSRVFELGGRLAVDFEAYVRGLGRRYRTRPALGVRVPGVLARLGAHLCDLFHFSPFSFGHWELLCRDNIPKPNRLPELLGREPEPVIDVG